MSRAELGVPQRELQPERHRLGVHAVRAADHRRAPMLLGARADGVAQRRRGPARTRSQASRICSACAVSMTSDDVSPKCSQRADGPTCSATAVVNAMTSCWVTASISSMRAMSNAPSLADVARRLGGHEAGARPWPRRRRSPPAATSRIDAGRSRCDPSRGGCSAESSASPAVRSSTAARRVRPSPFTSAPQHRRRPRPWPTSVEELARHPLHVLVRHGLDARERLVQVELPVEVHLLPRQVRHAARRALEARA